MIKPRTLAMLLSLTTLNVMAMPAFSTESIQAVSQETPQAISEVKSPRIVSASHPLTQIVSALDREELFVGLDKTSHTKPSLEKIPDIGYRIQLSTEGILSLNPDLILLAFDSGPANVIEQLHASKVEIQQFPELKDVPSIQNTVTVIAEELGMPAEGEALKQRVAADAASLEALSKTNPPLSGFFVLQESADAGSLQISGADTAADKLLNLLNINNLFAKDFINYRAIALENQLQTRPDIVLIGQRIHFDPELDAKAAPLAPFTLRESGMKGWPAALQPKCVFEVNMSNYLVYGINIFEESEALLGAIHQCLADKK